MPVYIHCFRTASPRGEPVVSEKKKYDSTVARIAGNIMSGYEWYDLTPRERDEFAAEAVAMARAIVAETQRTEPAPAVDAVREEP